MNVNSKTSRRLPRTYMACLIALGLLVGSVSAFADTYNFYFTKPKKKGGAVDNAPAGENEDDAEAAPPVPKAAGEQVTVGPNGQQPIIINNNNNIKMPEATPTSAEPEPVAPPPSSTNESAATVATFAIHDEYRAPWHFGISTAMYTGRRTRSLNYSYDSTYSYYSSSYDYYSQGTQWAGLINIGVDFNNYWGLNLYASQVVANKTGTTFDTGGDCEFTPFHISGPKYDYVRIGVMAGTSIASLQDNSFPFDVGARISFNFDRTFGLTGAVRTNFTMAMAEAGIVTHF